MKVAFVAPMKSYGGIERTLMTLVREFRRRDVTVILAMLRDSQTPYPEELPSDVAVYDLDTRSKLDGIGKVATFLRDQQPDAVITAKDHGAQVTLLARMIYHLEVPVYVTVTNMWSLVISRRVQRLFVRWLYPKADGIIAVSQGVKRDLCHHFGIPEHLVQVIYNPVETAGESGDVATVVSTAPNAPYEEADRVPVILGIGRLEPQKDFALLVRAFARLRAQRRCRLLILGEGSQRSVLESLAAELGVADDVDLPGQVSSAIPYLRGAALFALSSRWEGFGIVLAEALAAGTPVVATDCPSGPAEILEAGRFGPLVPVGDVAAFAEAMAQVLDAPPDSEVLMRAADRFAPSRVADAYLAALGIGSRASVRIRP
ncbi:glycosyltransferase [Halofilum ochraceum]|uniref:glycosyltransferase n=1 Tax=Halofilum ochraceum TaxID=1611323 RepID=UPI0008D9BAE7|nr:glycosyltransferase [Halofilum ochraceum]